MARRWLGTMGVALALLGCGAQATATDDAAVVEALDDQDVALLDVPPCSHPLVALTKVPLTTTIAQAKTAAQTYCYDFPLSAGEVPCSDGGTLVYGRSGYVGETWWFNASGVLIGYRWSTDNGFATGCLENMWGSNGVCTDAPDVDPARTSICATPTDATDTSDAPADSGDTGGEVAPDVPADIAVAATACATQADCSATTWCDNTGCGFTLGKCQPKPIDCAGQFSPICGCDGHSYDSACTAQQAGKAIAAYAAPCLGTGCAPACASGYTCVDCASAGGQCLTPGQKCVGGK